MPQSVVSLLTCSLPMNNARMFARRIQTLALVRTCPVLWFQLVDNLAGQVGKVLGERWKALSESERRPYEDKAKADKERYDAEKASYAVSTIHRRVGKGLILCAGWRTGRRRWRGVIFLWNARVTVFWWSSVFLLRWLLLFKPSTVICLFLDLGLPHSYLHGAAMMFGSDFDVELQVRLFFIDYDGCLMLSFGSGWAFFFLGVGNVVAGILKLGDLRDCILPMSNPREYFDVLPLPFVICLYSDMPSSGPVFLNITPLLDTPTSSDISSHWGSSATAKSIASSSSSCK